MLRKNWIAMLLALVLVMSFVAGCAPPAPPPPAPPAEEKPAEPVEPAKEKVKIFAVFATPAEEPWVSVITAACEKLVEEGLVEFAYTDNLGYAGDVERVFREVAESGKYDIITGESFGNEEAVRRVAKDFPEIPFVIGSGLGPTEPNFAVFDNWIHEPAYLLGMLAGGLTKTNKVGVVGGVPVPEVNRITNAFIRGAKDQNPNVTVYVSFINAWFDPAKAKEQALAHIDAGADVLYAERFGVIEAAAENGLWVFGQMNDQHELAPDYVVSSSVWNLTPTFEYVLAAVKAGVFTAQDLKDFSMMGKGGAVLAPYYGLEAKLPADLLAAVEAKKQEILNGAFRVDIDESTPGAVN
ncbi:MAG: BMP family protein [Anaerolineaceae bacterium]|nr:BMP family protein [Anaerolineaceae bacterium]